MNAKRAIHILSEINQGKMPRNGVEISQAIKLAIQVLEKQIPSKVEIKEWSPCECPSCGKYLSESAGDGYYNHWTSLDRCPKIECGQRLDWGTELF